MIKYAFTILVVSVLFIAGISAGWWLGRHGVSRVRPEQSATLDLNEFAEAAKLLPKESTITAGRRLEGDFFWFGAEKRYPVEKTGAGPSLKELDKSEFQSWLVSTKSGEAKLVKNRIPLAPFTQVSIHDSNDNRFFVVTTRNDSIHSAIKGWVDDYFVANQVDGPVLSVRSAREDGQFIELDNGVKKTKIQLAPAEGCKGVQKYSPRLATGLLFNGKEFPFDEPRRVMCLGHDDEYDWLTNPILLSNDYLGGLELWFYLPGGDLVIVTDPTGENPQTDMTR